MGRRDWPLRFYSAERLFSVEARRQFVPPDLAPLPLIIESIYAWSIDGWR